MKPELPKLVTEGSRIRIIFRGLCGFFIDIESIDIRTIYPIVPQSNLSQQSAGLALSWEATMRLPMLSAGSTFALPSMVRRHIGAETGCQNTLDVDKSHDHLTESLPPNVVAMQGAGHHFGSPKRDQKRFVDSETP
jgi:hypothetical protein